MFVTHLTRQRLLHTLSDRDCYTPDLTEIAVIIRVIVSNSLISIN